MGCTRSDVVEIRGGGISLGFDRQTGRLVSFQDVGRSRELIDPSAVTGLPWRLEEVSSESALDHGKVSFRKRGGGEMDISWTYGGECPVEVIVSVSLEKDRPVTHWRASYKGLKEAGCAGVTCPVISGIKAYDNADLMTASWMGELIHDPGLNATEEKPVIYSCGFPGSTLQMMALYDRESLEGGMYLSSQDTLSSAKGLTYSFTPGHVSVNATNNIPDKGETDDYAPGYDVVVGLFDGDWFDAARIYREWTTEGKFCRESRLQNGKTPEWLEKTAFWIWNRGYSSNVLKEAEDLQERLGQKYPVNTYWHWWHGCPYDEGFPEYVPPREGKESFVKAVDHAHEKGIHSLVYMNSIQWGDSTESWKTEGAETYAARRPDGGTYRYVYQIFSGNGLTPMCLATQFWRDKYSSLCDMVVNNYHVDGVYMDQACLNYPCFNPDHGHPLGGGSYWVDGFGKLTDQIRGTFKEGTDAMLAGEGTGEDWIPLLDDFLALQPSVERYSGVSNREPIPLFQAVYHDYAMSYGSYSSLVYPPYDDLWTKEFRPSNAETLLPEEFNMQFRMEQARAFVWGMQPTLANYHSFLFEKRKVEMEFLVDIIKTRYNALEYLLYGEMKALPKSPATRITIPISKVNIYVGRKGDNVTRYEKEVNTIFSCAWLSKEGGLGVAVSNIADDDAEVTFKVDAGKYGIAPSGNVSVISAGGKESKGDYSDGDEIKVHVPARTSLVLELK